MIKQILTGMILAAGLAVTASAADVVIRVGPPRNQVERRPASPGRGYVWQPGYHNYNDNAYAWTSGRWEQPPRQGSRWEQHRWQRQRDGNWVLVQGRWR
jgi:hypothetical protein